MPTLTERYAILQTYVSHGQADHIRQQVRERAAKEGRRLCMSQVIKEALECYGIKVEKK
ncbi:MAG TPA: hypothetical protein VGP72_27040 [Planctomycetota bacterium]|jgi:hypothetical protein